MKLAALLETLPEVQTTGKLPDSIQALEYDSRRVAPDSLFIALRGAKVDGHEFAAQAAQRFVSSELTRRLHFGKDTWFAGLENRRTRA